MKFAVLIAACGLVAYAAQTPTPLVDRSKAELIETLPELRTLEFDSDQADLPNILAGAGQRVDAMLARVVDITFAEQVHEMRFESTRLMWTEHRDEFQYKLQANGMTETRNPALNEKSPFLISGPFFAMLADLALEEQPRSRFRFLGQAGDVIVVAFSAKDKTHEGIAWLDESSGQILRLRVYNLVELSGFDTVVRDVRFAVVNRMWLPASATVGAAMPGLELYSVHRFSHQSVKTAALADDAIETLVKAVKAVETGTATDAIAPLRETLTRLPDRIEAAYYLGFALRTAHDLAGSEEQFRAVVKRMPALAVAHNQLATVLYERGDKAGAAAELKEAVRLEPSNAKFRANLEALAKAAPAAIPSDPSAIQVEVKQVLVPVVVTDRDHHHITGLKQTDFAVFEDGVEQKISSFSSERADATTEVQSSPDSKAPATNAVEPAKPLAKRNTYVVCLDLLHLSMTRFVQVRDAMKKLFQREAPGGSDYAVIALGTPMAIVQQVTPDPAKVLETLASDNFLKIFSTSQRNSSKAQINSYEGDLQRVRAACDGGDPSCLTQMRRLPSQAHSIAEQERLRTKDFLAQFRSVVEQASRGRGRRTIVLISDGFLMAPGKIPYDLYNVYFPPGQFPADPSARSLPLEANERIEDGFDAIFRIAAQNNVTVHTVDSRGLYTGTIADASRTTNISVASQVDRAFDGFATDAGLTLSEIAAATGGTQHQNSNDLFDGLARAFADGREYYLLAYTSSNRAENNKFRKIEVRVRNKSATVSAKRGYWQ